MGGGIGKVTHHPQYYMDDGSISFLTGGVLFRVHKYYFARESDLFREWFESEIRDDPLVGTDAIPFTLDVEPDEFAQFLWVWYDRDYTYREQSKENWVTILRLATRWNFNKIKELALREMEYLRLPPAEMISIYNEHGIDGERLLSSCVELCKSPTIPSMADACHIQMDTLIRILQAREDAQRKAAELGHESPTSACLEDDVLREIVSRLFKKGLNPQPSGTPTGSGDQAPDLINQRNIRETPIPKPTIIVGAPQVPDRKVKTTEPPPHQTESNGKANQEKEQGDRVESKNAHKQVKQVGEGEDAKKPVKPAQDEKAKVNGETEKRDKETEERKKTDKAQQEAKKKEKEKEKEDKKVPENSRKGRNN